MRPRTRGTSGGAPAPEEGRGNRKQGSLRGATGGRRDGAEANRCGPPRNQELLMQISPPPNDSPSGGTDALLGRRASQSARRLPPASLQTKAFEIVLRRATPIYPHQPQISERGTKENECFRRDPRGRLRRVPKMPERAHSSGIAESSRRRPEASGDPGAGLK